MHKNAKWLPISINTFLGSGHKFGYRFWKGGTQFRLFLTFGEQMSLCENLQMVSLLQKPFQERRNSSAIPESPNSRKSHNFIIKNILPYVQGRLLLAGGVLAAAGFTATVALCIGGLQILLTRSFASNDLFGPS
jgi:hypothetical protein